MNIPAILRRVESAVASQEERAYFLVHEARYKRILEEIQEITKTDSRLRGNDRLKILDVGCYPYHLGAAMEKMGIGVWGIAGKHEPINNKNVAILNIETDKFPYRSNFFDVVLCSEVIEHLPRSPVPALKEMLRVAKKGSHLLITTPNITRSINQGKMLLGKSPIPPVEEGMNIYHRHNHEYTLGELSRVVSRAGWTVEKAVHYISYSPFRRKNRQDHPLIWTGKFANFLAMAAVPRLRDTLMVIGKK